MTPKVFNWLVGATETAFRRAAENYDVPEDFTEVEEAEALAWLQDMANQAFGLVDQHRGD